MEQTIRKVGVIGAGQMGNGIAHVCALAGLDVRLNDGAVRRLVAAFPANDAEVNRELARLLGVLAAEDPRLLDAISRKWTSQSTTEDDIHYLIVSALLPGQRSKDDTAREVWALLNLETKLRTAGGHPSQNWPLRVGEMFDELCQRDPDVIVVLPCGFDIAQARPEMKSGNPAPVP